jgi:hypothetical protein
MAPNRVLGLLLIAIGGALLLAITTDVGGELVVGALGAGFLVAYATTGAYGLLVPGAILTGLGTGIVIAEQGGPEEAVVLGLGLGFLAIAVVDVLRGSPGGAWWWPLIPGAILTTVGASEMVGMRDLGRYVVPAILILIGVGLLIRRHPAPSEGGPGDRVAHDGRPPGP